MSATISKVRERPILFSGDMVRAILDGRKTQTRRVLQFPRAIREIEGGAALVAFDRMQPGYRDGSTRAVFDFDGEPNSFSVRCPYGSAGDRLWVRESHYVWTAGYQDRTGLHVVYRATEPDAPNTWTPSIHMPRFASRITLEVTGVRVERVQEITANDCIAEGIPSRGMDRDGPCIAAAIMYVSDYQELWDKLNAKRGYGWDANPWVWVIEFRRVESAAVSLPGDEQP